MCQELSLSGANCLRRKAEYRIILADITLLCGGVAEVCLSKNAAFFSTINFYVNGVQYLARNRSGRHRHQRA